jgi:hypothetical protein
LYSNTAKNIGGIDDHHYLYFIFLLEQELLTVSEELGSLGF